MNLGALANLIARFRLQRFEKTPDGLVSFSISAFRGSDGLTVEDSREVVEMSMMELQNVAEEDSKFPNTFVWPNGMKNLAIT